MRKPELAAAIAERADLSKDKASQVLNVILDEITGSVSSGQDVSLIGFGTFTVRERAARTGKNPQTGQPLQILQAVQAVNQRQKLVLIDKIVARFGPDLQDHRFALWGLAFKPRTDDIREAPALVLLEWLLQKAAIVRVHDMTRHLLPVHNPGQKRKRYRRHIAWLLLEPAEINAGPVKPWGRPRLQPPPHQTQRLQ